MTFSEKDFEYYREYVKKQDSGELSKALKDYNTSAEYKQAASDELVEREILPTFLALDLRPKPTAVPTGHRHDLSKTTCYCPNLFRDGHQPGCHLNRELNEFPLLEGLK